MMQSERGPDRVGRRTVTQRVLALPGAVFRAGLDWLRDGRYRARHRRLIDVFEDAGVLDEMLSESGATRQHLGWAGLSPLAAGQLMNRMMRRLEIRAPAASEQPFWRQDALWQCLGCDNWRRCRRWLESGRRDDAYRAFCQNGERFAARRAQRPARPVPVRAPS